MDTPATVLEALRRFVPELRKTAPALSAEQHRALWAITHCRTAALGGRVFACTACGHRHLAYHSCNHKACPQCGAHAAHRWVERQLANLIHAPYFLVTFTLPAELRPCFFGPRAKEAYDLFFAAVSAALTEKLAADKAFPAQVSGFVALLHTWTQKLEFHPHIHCLVPGAGLNDRHDFVRVKKPEFLLYLPHLQAAFRQHLYQLLKDDHWQVDPQVWRKDWGVHIQPAGSGASAVKYLGAYVTRTAITNARILRVDPDSVTFRWKDRADHNQTKLLTLPGVEFARRYLRHVLPAGLRSVRYYGFCHPTAQANRLRVQVHSGRTVLFGDAPAPSLPEACPPCPRCGQPSRLVFSVSLYQPNRGPPKLLRSQGSISFAA